MDSDRGRDPLRSVIFGPFIAVCADCSLGSASIRPLHHHPDRLTDQVQPSPVRNGPCSSDMAHGGSKALVILLQCAWSFATEDPPDGRLHQLALPVFLNPPRPVILYRRPRGEDLSQTWSLPGLAGFDGPTRVRPVGLTCRNRVGPTEI